MTITGLIQSCLARISAAHYHGRKNDFFRDRLAIQRAIATYGHECLKREWHFNADQIYEDISTVLDSCLRNRDTIRYLPTYLAGAVRKHIGLRAEELSAAAKQAPRRAVKIISGVKPVAEIVSSDTDLLAAIHKSLAPAKRRKIAQKHPPARHRPRANASAAPSPSQPTLF